MISFENVSKKYGTTTVVDDISFSVGEGEVVGLLGPNGAGKTTTLRLLTGILPASKGRVEIDDRNPLENQEIRNNIGFLPENNPLYTDMTVEEWLKFWAEIKSEQAITQERIWEVVKQIGLDSVYFRPISELSKGYKQRVGLGQAILAKPRILVLDEPTEGLDPNQRAEIHQLIKDLGKKRTVIISSHILAEITKMCSRVIIIHKGKIVADGKPGELGSKKGARQSVRALIGGRAIKTTLAKLPGVKEVVEEKGSEGEPATYMVHGVEGKDLRLEIFELAKQKDWKLFELSRHQAGLEDVFARLTKE